MCQFMSWIKYKGQTLFLTDKDVFSSHGRKTLKNTKPEDWIGHGAIRAYYGLRVDEGTEYESRYFWEVANPEIQEALKDFDNNFKRIWKSGALRSHDLRWLVCYAPEEWKKRAWGQLLNQSPNADNMRYIACFAPDKYADRAWKRLALMGRTGLGCVISIVYTRTSDKRRERAWKHILKQKSQKQVFADIFCYAPDKYADRAWRHYIKHNMYLTCEELLHIFLNIYSDWFDKRAGRAWKWFLRHHPSEEELSYIVCCSPSENLINEYAEKAWKRLVKHGPSKTTLQFIAYNARRDDLVQKALNELRKRYD